jgi:hypothetical protein
MAQLPAPAINYANYPLANIPHPHPHDVLCGRGGGTNNHVGNSHWRMLVAANKQLYITLPKRQKMLLSRSIVNAVRSQNPPGRFLQKDSKSNFLFDVGDQRAQEKTSQALREGAPDIRVKVAGKNSTGSDEDVEATENPTEHPGDDDQNSTDPNKKKETNKTDPVLSSSTTINNIKPPAPAHAPTLTPPTTTITPPPTPHQHQPGMFMHPPGASRDQVMYYSQAPNMQPVQVYPTMVVNEQGRMVQAMSVMPPMNPSSMIPTPPHPPVTSQSGDTNVSARRAEAADRVGALPNYQNHYNPNQNNNMDPISFDDYAATLPPGALDPGGLSFGSFDMTDFEQRNLESTGVSFGSAMSYTQQQTHPNTQHPTHHHYNNNHYPQHHAHATASQSHSHAHATPHATASAPIPAHHAFLPPSNSSSGNNPHSKPEQFKRPSDTSAPGLEGGVGTSFGDVSMMSVGTMKLDGGVGTSFGTMMSYNTIRADAVEGGLEAVGTSFGSLSLDTTTKERLYQSLEVAAAGPEIPPMFQAQRSTANLLDCSDTDSEDSNDKQQLVAQKSAAWEKLQATIAVHTQGNSGSQDEMPPPPVGGMVMPPPGNPHNNQMLDGTPVHFSIPITHMERDFSQLSTWGLEADEYGGAHEVYPGEEYDNPDLAAIPTPPAPMVKHDDEGERLEMYYLQRGSSLTEEEFQNKL